MVDGEAVAAEVLQQRAQPLPRGLGGRPHEDGVGGGRGLGNGPTGNEIDSGLGWDPENLGYWGLGFWIWDLGFGAGLRSGEGDRDADPPPTGAPKRTTTEPP